MLSRLPYLFRKLFTREGEGDIKCTYMAIFSGPTDVTLLIT